MKRFAVVLCVLLTVGGCALAKTKTSTIIWPFGGLHKGVGYQTQPPYTCPQASNVRTVETLEGRRRGGRRPGLAIVYPKFGWWDTPPESPTVLRQITSTSGRRLFGWSHYHAYHEVAPGIFQVIFGGTSTKADLSSLHNLESAEYLGQLYIADRGGVGAYWGGGGTDSGDLVGATVNAATVTGSSIGLATLEDRGVRAGQAVTLTERNGSGISGTYTVQSISGNTITLTESTGATGDAYAYIERQPKIWDPETRSLTPLVPTAGDVNAVLGYRLVCRYSNRLFWAGNPDYPYAWICSRAGDPLDYDFSWGLDDVARATYWQANDQKTIGQPIKALIPSGNDYLIFGCTNSLWILTGDPTYGGSLRQLDPNVGVLSETAWCSVPGAGIIVLSHDGLYAISGGGVTPISKGKLPKELIGIDPTLYTISMCYEPRHRGVHVFATKTAYDTHEQPIAYWIDLEQQAFWPVEFDITASKDHSPLRAELELLDNGSSRVLIASKYGALYYFSDSAVKDGNQTTGATVTGTVTLGPFRLGANDFNEGMLTKLVGILDEQSADVTYTIHVADTAEGAIEAAAHSTGTWSAGRSMPDYVRARGASMCIKLSGTGLWALESIVAEIERLGMVRITDWRPVAIADLPTSSDPSEVFSVIGGPWTPAQWTQWTGNFSWYPLYKQTSAATLDDVGGFDYDMTDALEVGGAVDPSGNGIIFDGGQLYNKGPIADITPESLMIWVLASVDWQSPGGDHGPPIYFLGIGTHLWPYAGLGLETKAWGSLLAGDIHIFLNSPTGATNHIVSPSLTTGQWVSIIAVINPTASKILIDGVEATPRIAPVLPGSMADWGPGGHWDKYVSSMIWNVGTIKDMGFSMASAHQTDEEIAKLATYLESLKP